MYCSIGDARLYVCSLSYAGSGGDTCVGISCPTYVASMTGTTREQHDDANIAAARSH